MKTGILWDLDGTLLDTLQDLADSVNYTMRAFGCPQRSLQEVRCFVGNGVEMLISKALPQEGRPALSEAVGVYKTYYNAHSQVKTAPYPGILSVLAQLKDKYPMAIVSNKPDKAVKPLCRHFFGDILARGETEDCPRKPAPDMVLQTMAQLGVEKCIYVGDSEVDVLTARNAGAVCLSVTWGFRDEDLLRQAGAEHFCRRPEELVQAIEQLARQL